MKEEKIVSRVVFILLTVPITSIIWKPLKSLLNRSSCPIEKVQVEELALLEDQKMVWLINCLSIHKSKDFLDWMKLNYPKVCVIFIPTNYIGVLQLVNVILQCLLKHAFKR
jgi:hypothetical protein